MWESMAALYIIKTDNTVLFWHAVIRRFSAFFDVLRYLTYLNKLFKKDTLRNVECRITCYQLIIEDVVGSKV